MTSESWLRKVLPPSSPGAHIRPVSLESSSLPIASGVPKAGS